MNEEYSHRDTGEFDPTHDLAPENQSWCETFFDGLLLLVDPTGQEQITSVKEATERGMPVTLNGIRYRSLHEAAQDMDRDTKAVRRLYKAGELGKLEEWHKNGAV